MGKQGTGRGNMHGQIAEQWGFWIGDLAALWLVEGGGRGICVRSKTLSWSSRCFVVVSCIRVGTYTFV